MSPKRQALIFDLDDTLYPLRQFALSGFRAVASHLAAVAGLEECEVFQTLTDARANGGLGREFQICFAHYGLSATLLPATLSVFRNHHPNLRLPLASRNVLAALRSEWRLAILTNGVPAIQARKVRALGVDMLVDAVVYACAVGNGCGKPSPEAFLEAAARLDCPLDRTVMVGDDPHCDIDGASRVGMKAIHVVTPELLRRHDWHCTPDTTVRSLLDVPAAAEGLMAGWSSHAA
jgi:putative hydrolase of the HAD superfamily